MYKVGDKITVNDKMQSGYSYRLDAPMGKNFDPAFKPHLRPKKCLNWAYLKENIVMIAGMNSPMTGLRMQKSVNERMRL